MNIIYILFWIIVLVILYTIIKPSKPYTNESWEKELEDNYNEEAWIKYQKGDAFKKDEEYFNKQINGKNR